ncbi:MAG: hypothetical protein JW837_19080 [Sedimentisphaerales bacterium]|nr:hypothetical protein [Sedimentisphaerales bacterium]
MWNIFEQPWTLLVAASIAILLIAIIKNSIPDKHRILLRLIPVLIAALGLGLDYFIKTDTEQIKTIIKTAVKSVENEQPKVIEPLIADDYQDSMHKNKNEIMKECRAYLRPPFVDNVFYSISSLDINKNEASVVLLNRIFFEEGSEYSEWIKVMTAEFKIDFRKTAGKGWVVSQVELSSLNGNPAKWKDICYGNL